MYDHPKSVGQTIGDTKFQDTLKIPCVSRIFLFKVLFLSSPKQFYLVF
ncbi:hypothetical protein LEP1GSC017_0754 [Leptospira meyeri serovar Hardjo str. Went 5]|nr:hypothetical protein LEP1GSC017_0754 [Leptospira meyeri serovar Hardjo str. Went 5]